MKYNVGNIDRLLRIVLGIIIFAVAYYYQSLWGIVGIIPLVSGITGFCPLYGAFGLSTCPAGDESINIS